MGLTAVSSVRGFECRVLLHSPCRKVLRSGFAMAFPVAFPSGVSPVRFCFAPLVSAPVLRHLLVPAWPQSPGNQLISTART